MGAHSAKKLDVDDLKAFRDRFNIPIADQDIEAVPYFRPAPDSEEIRYLQEHRRKLGGYLPARKPNNQPLTVPVLGAFRAQLEGSGERVASTTMAFVRLLGTLVRDPTLASASCR